MNEYAAARRAINQHLHRHHEGQLARGDLRQRLAWHDRLHNSKTSHEHSTGHDGEAKHDTALRYLQEGEAQQRYATSSGASLALMDYHMEAHHDIPDKISPDEILWYHQDIHDSEVCWHAHEQDHPDESPEDLMRRYHDEGERG